MPPPISDDLNARLAKIKLFLCDVDGILTDASVFIGEEQEIKRFYIRDGLGFIMLREEGIKIGWVSNRPSIATTKRAEELKIDFLEQGKGSKVTVVENLLGRAGFKWEEVCYMGDDVVDLGVLKRAGVAAPATNATDQARAAPHYVTRASGGNGGVPQVIELILKAQNRWEKVVARNSA